MGGPGRESFEATAWFDANVVDGAVNGAGGTVRSAAGGLRRIQNGYVRATPASSASASPLLLAWLVDRAEESLMRHRRSFPILHRCLDRARCRLTGCVSFPILTVPSAAAGRCRM